MRFYVPTGHFDPPHYVTEDLQSAECLAKERAREAGLGLVLLQPGNERSACSYWQFGKTPLGMGYRFKRWNFKTKRWEQGAAR